MKGFGGSTVLEISDTYDGNAWRAIYTVKFRNAIYVLHAFQKKSRQGIATPETEIRLIKERLNQAKMHHEKN